MDSEKLKGVISLLREDQKELDKQKTAIDTVIEGLTKRYGLPSDDMSSTKLGKDPETGGSMGGKDVNFPRKASFEDQIVYLFKHHIKKAEQYPEIQRVFDIVTEHRYLRDDLMALRRNNKPVITAIKFNKNSNLTYTGLTEWVVMENGEPRFRKEYMNLRADKFPRGIVQSEWANLPVTSMG